MIQDIYGELLDCIYLAQKFSKPLVSLDGHALDIVLMIVMGFMGTGSASGRLRNDSSQREGSQYLGSTRGEQTFPLFQSHDVGRARQRITTRRKEGSTLS